MGYVCWSRNFTGTQNLAGFDVLGIHLAMPEHLAASISPEMLQGDENPSHGIHGTSVFRADSVDSKFQRIVY